MRGTLIWAQVTGLFFATLTFAASNPPSTKDENKEEFHVRHQLLFSSHLHCGGESLYVCLHTMGYQLRLADLETDLPINAQGVSMEAISECAHKYTVHVTAIQTDIHGLIGCGFPMIVHVKDAHFVAIVGIENGRFIVFDNSTGLFDCTPDFFSRIYQWESGPVLTFANSSPIFTISKYRNTLVLASCFLFLYGFFLLFIRSKKFSTLKTMH